MYYNILYLPYKPGTGTSPVRRNVACSCPQLIIAICYDARPPSWWQKGGRSSVHKNQETPSPSPQQQSRNRRSYHEICPYTRQIKKNRNKPVNYYKQKYLLRNV